MYKGITLIENPQLGCDRLRLLNKYFLTDFSMKELNDKNT
jgi:hypothetical protein